MSAVTVFVLAAVRVASVVRYREALTKELTFKPTVVTSEQAARDLLADSTRYFDAFVIDNNLGNAFELVKELRQAYPRLAIVLVDEEADFGMPGRADEVSTTPFTDDDLVKKIKRLMQERRVETLRADALPPVRMFAKRINKDSKGASKHQAAVETVKELGYDYVAFYAITPTDPPVLSLSAQTGSATVQSLVPTKTDYSGLLGWVVQNGQSKIVGPDDQPNHILIEKGKFGAAACVPVGTTLRFGVFLACREQSGSISREGVLMLELIASQLAAALAKDARK